MTTTTVKTTCRWATVCTVGYTGSVSRNENRAAHGGVCHVLLRRNAGGKVVARKVNSNGRHQEVGETFAPTAEQIEHWNSIAAASR